jgi:hypothetical protein
LFILGRSVFQCLLISLSNLLNPFISFLAILGKILMPQYRRTQHYVNVKRKVPLPISWVLIFYNACSVHIHLFSVCVSLSLSLLSLSVSRTHARTGTRRNRPFVKEILYVPDYIIYQSTFHSQVFLWGDIENFNFGLCILLRVYQSNTFFRPPFAAVFVV